MRWMLALATLALVTTVSAAAPPAGAAPSSAQQIDLARPCAVGQTMRIRAEGSQDRTVSAVAQGAEHVMERGRVTISFDAQAEVMVVDVHGRPTRVEYVVSECLLNVQGETTEVAARGAVIVAQRRGATTTFEMNGRPLAREAAGALDIVASLGGDGPTDDEILGSRTPRRVGDSWPIDAASAARALQSGPGAPIDPSAIAGRTTLVDVKPYRGVSCQHVRSELTIDGAVPGMTLPPGFGLTSASVSATFESMYPAEVGLPALATRAEMVIDAALTGQAGPGGEAIEMRVRGVRSARIEVTPLGEVAAVAGVTEMP